MQILAAAESWRSAALGQDVAMPQKQKLTPLERDVLWTLEEAGEESLVTVMNSISPCARTTDAVSAARELEDGVRNLMRLGLIALVERDKEAPRVRQALSSTPTLSDVVRYDRRAGLWQTLTVERADLWLELTAAGERAVQT